MCVCVSVQRASLSKVIASINQHFACRSPFRVNIDNLSRLKRVCNVSSLLIFIFTLNRDRISSIVLPFISPSPFYFVHGLFAFTKRYGSKSLFKCSLHFSHFEASANIDRCKEKVFSNSSTLAALNCLSIKSATEISTCNGWILPKLLIKCGIRERLEIMSGLEVGCKSV